MLRRDPDPGGLQNYLTVLEERRRSRPTVCSTRSSRRWSCALDVPYRNTLRSLHQSRCDFVRMLPRAPRILDLGGTDQADDAGALVSMGYPYHFELLTIVDLPGGDRHELYGFMASSETVGSRCGPVQYRYHSMVDLSAYPDARVRPRLQWPDHRAHHRGRGAEDARRGPARASCRVDGSASTPPTGASPRCNSGADVLSNPDHKLEYTHEHLSGLLRDAGFEVVGAYGLGLADESLGGRGVRHGRGRGQARRVRGDRRLLLPRVHVPHAFCRGGLGGLGGPAGACCDDSHEGRVAIDRRRSSGSGRRRSACPASPSATRRARRCRDADRARLRAPRSSRTRDRRRTGGRGRDVTAQRLLTSAGVPTDHASMSTIENDSNALGDTSASAPRSSPHFTDSSTAPTDEDVGMRTGAR